MHTYYVYFHRILRQTELRTIPLNYNLIFICVQCRTYAWHHDKSEYFCYVLAWYMSYVVPRVAAIPCIAFPHGLYYTRGSLMISYTSGYYVHLTSSYVCISRVHTKLTPVHICERNMCSNA